MKNTILSLLLLSANFVFSQNIVEVRKATLVDGDYATEGDVFLELYDDNSLKLRFGSNYRTTNNVFDVHVYLNNNNDYRAPIDVSDFLLVANIGTISGLNYSSGPRTFDLPEGVGINDYNHIVLVCVRFGRLHWGNGEFEQSTLSIIENDFKNNLIAYPNPTDGNVSIDLGDVYNSAEITISDLNGKLVHSETFSKKQICNMSLDEPNGTYFITVKADNKQAIIKLLKE